MPGRDEIFRSIFGAWRLAHLDVSGMNYFDFSADGFYRSFVAPLLVAPFFLLLILLQADAKTDIAQLVGTQSIAYLLLWIGFPLLMILICRQLDLSGNYVPFVVAYNWSQIVVIAFFLPLDAVIASNVFGKGGGAILSLAGSTLGCIYLWFIARTALQTTTLIAIGITIAEVLLELIVQRGLELLI